MSMIMLATFLVGLLASEGSAPQLVPVRHPEGVVHGFLALRSTTGDLLAEGALLQTSRGNEVTSRLVFHFHDGSMHDETAVYAQRGTFRLLRDHVIQKGPSFPTSLDATFDVSRGTVTIRSRKEGEQEDVHTDRMALPADLANGLLFTLLKNVKPDTPRIETHFLAFTPKPRVVRLEISPVGEDAFALGNSTIKATHFVVHPELGGVTGLIAPLVGKEPPDMHIWILFTDVPAFLRFEGSLYTGGPTWRIEYISPH